MGDAAVLFLTGAGTGLLAGGGSCAAVQLGLLTGAVRDAPRPAVPVTAFLTAKLVTHTALGALLGIVGAAVQPGPRARAALMLAAAAVILVFALDLLGFPPARRLLHRSTIGSGAEHCSGAEPGTGAEHCATAPPRRARTRRPAALGAATVLLPCGVTLSTELLAITSRSALAGAAVMAGFVLGTAPVAALLGMGLGRGMAVLRGRLTAFVGVALVAVAGWTLLSGLRLGGWLPGPAGAATARNVMTDSTGTQVITIGAADRGYRPALVTARSGVRTVLVVRTHGNRGCTRAFTIPSKGLERMLPETGDTRLDLGTPEPGRLGFTCASGHYPGAISFR
ncbi:sulfite exporter TauE/SafE family protein [Actinomadura sp. 9N407]|uniref:urease accessory protein UreH domain-containing protein n=1 Tax=Actinomadura sp. 9N407 TaxID=3375154 RepID=UPI0037A4F147